MNRDRVCVILSALLITTLTLAAQSPAEGQKHVFTLGKKEFLLDGKPYQLISGEMHPARIPKPYWRHRIQMAKAMGCNTIAVYIFWNYLESAPGIFDFHSGNHDIAEFIRICKEEGMWVLLRPGPYVCAEWDFGGLPSYLLKIPDIKIRCMDSRYMAAVTRYITRLSKEILPLQCSLGGPVLMVQLENEYGSYGDDRKYLLTLRKIWVQNGIRGPFYTADGATAYMLEAGSIPDAAIGLDSGGSEEDFAEAKKINPNLPSFSSETYPGWLTHWKEKWARTSTADVLKELTFLLENKKSFNLYVIHGGTNFGFTAGANAFSLTAFQPDITSYDYDAPINEQGQPTEKYFAIRNLIAKYISYKIPDLPNPIPVIDIPSFQAMPFTCIWKNLPAPINAVQPKPMEDFNQGSGFILYTTKLIGHKSGKLTITEPHDYAMVFLNGKLIDTVYRDGGRWTIELPETGDKEPLLSILVEAMGHINFAQYMIDRKGITDRVTLNGISLMNWKVMLLPLEEKYVASLKSTYPEGNHDGVFFKAWFNLDQTGDTYFDLSNYQKGIVWVNGHNLGRYWNTGPQFHLYCPAGWLQIGRNEVIILDLHQQQGALISGVKTLE
jgi:beta-galactosidase